MTLTKQVNGEVLPLTDEEAAEVTARQEAWTNGADDRAASILREDRNKLLDDSDWTQMNDSPLNNEDKIAWANYRTLLRDLPTHTNWPNLEDADWPVAP